MRGIIALVGLLAFAFFPPSGARAEGVALVIANENYTRLPDLRGAARLARAAEALEDAGFALVVASDAEPDAMASAFARLEAASAGAPRLVVLLAGQFAHSDRETWFLPPTAARPTLARLNATALPLSSVLTVLAQAPGAAFLMLASEPSDAAYGPLLQAGVGALDIPQGVTLIAASPAALRTGLGRATPPGTALADAFEREEISGFMPAGHALVPPPPAVPEEDAPEEPVSAPDSAVEQAYWDATRAVDTAEGYERYIARYPEGRFVAEARERAEAIRAEPARAARLEEEALALDRDARRAIQRNLTILGYDTRGVDGIFGRGSRGAISAWQERNGFAVTSYLDREQITRLAAQAERRAAELEREAEERRREQERLDRAYWEETGAQGDEDGLRLYLRRYPDGLFADVAEDQLAAIEGRNRDRAAAADRADWDRALAEGTEEAFRAYLDARPDGAFAEEARARIEALAEESRNAAAVEEARAEEEGLGLNQITRLLVEQRLAQLGLEPGRIDGAFDDETRRAIRRYQQARQLEVTGFLSRRTAARLLADSLQ
jgi:peptidoglycan hydrolase-like protein with peptidoglycan-binding domain